MKPDAPLKVAVLDMQPIEPATGGGRLRLLGLYHALGTNVRTLYVGTYDWRGPGYRRQMLSPTLEELLVPLSEAHFAEADARARAAGGRVVIDSIFPELAHLSPDYVAAARKAAAEADVVIFSHPWIYPLVRDLLDRARQLVVYDAHNVEGLLRMELLDDGGAGTEIVRSVVRVERALCQDADLILACSHEDRTAFNRLYDIPFECMRVFANGTFTEKIATATHEQKAAAREALKLGRSPVAFFVGSNYAPNVEAARFIASNLCAALPDILFVIAGGVGGALAGDRQPFNLRVTGSISEDEKHTWLRAADLAINPMFGGSGTNIKMLDYMAAGLPIVTTHVGARGLITGERAFIATNPAGFVRAVDHLVHDAGRSASLSRAAREQARMLFSWERISAELGVLLRRRAERLLAEPPSFSVVIPTFERHALLTRLVERLQQQSFGKFEVIIVDQSQEPWPGGSADHPIDILYFRTDVRGPGFARNTGAKLARGRIIAFVDDDCEPFADWLEGADKEFQSRGIVGLEGLVVSGRVGDPDWRAVTNEGFEGLGFMTANLFLKAEVFHGVNGFDAAFGDLPFREDTDLGWRAQELGTIPFSRLARVYHPPQPRAKERESLDTRSRFFERDALLMHKHPRRYAELMRREAQWASNPYFWTYFINGIKRYDVKIPEEVWRIMPKNIRAKCG
jgi:glycosyltransferase involved in cell wall biosynthesis